VPAEPPKPEPPKPVPAYVQAAQRRRRIPLWAMPVLAGLPLWGYVYVRTLEPAPVENDPFELGAEHYASSCASCHGGTGLGQGVVPALANGEVQATWPDFRDQLYWVKTGEEGWPSDTYGAQPKTKNSATMPAFGATLSEQEIAQIVLYERRELSDDVAPEGEEDVLLAIASGEMTFAEAGVGPLSEEVGITEADLEG
jgi:mono/diheme cytochrome c family protein